MRCWLTVLVACFLFVACGNKDDEQILFFTHNGCPYCDKALNYINTNYKELPMQILEVENSANMRRFIQTEIEDVIAEEIIGRYDSPIIAISIDVADDELAFNYV